MQNLMKIDRQKNQAFFNYSLRTLFSGHTVRTLPYLDVLSLIVHTASSKKSFKKLPGRRPAPLRGVLVPWRFLPRSSRGLERSRPEQGHRRGKDAGARQEED